MPTAEYDLGYLRAGLPILQNYLFSSDVYWSLRIDPPSGNPPYPSLTLSGLLLARQRARARPLTPNQLQELKQAGEVLDSTCSRWKVAWENKVAAEFHSRLKLWGDFLEEYREKPEAHFDRYTYEVNRRVQLQLLQKEVRALPTVESSLLDSLDLFLRGLLIPGKFIWEAELEHSFEQETYWYLYGKLPKERTKKY